MMELHRMEAKDRRLGKGMIPSLQSLYVQSYVGEC